VNRTKQVSKPSFKGDSAIPVEELMKLRENAIFTKEYAEKAIKEADSYNYQRAMLTKDYNIERDFAKKKITGFKIFGSRASAVREKWDNLAKDEFIRVEYVKSNKAFFQKVIEQSRFLIVKLDAEIEKLTGLPIEEVLAPIADKSVTSADPSKNSTSAKSKPVPPAPYIPNVNGKPTTPKPQVKITQSVEDLRILEDKWASMSDSDPEKASLGREISKLEELLKENNISFVPKAPAVFADEDEKITYVQCALLEADANEASAMDALSAFEKYGSRYTYGPNNSKNIRTGMADLSLAIDKIADKLESEPADRVINKYLDLFNKFARADGEYTDTRLLRLLIERHQSKMSEETVLKLIDTLKKFSFEKAQSWSVRRYILEDAYTKRTPEELSRIEARLQELEEIVKDMPMKDKSKK